jgi:hypothetical protein
MTAAFEVSIEHRFARLKQVMESDLVPQESRDAARRTVETILRYKAAGCNLDTAWLRAADELAPLTPAPEIR